MRWQDFLEDSKGIGSSTRLGMLFGVFIGGIIVLNESYYNSLTWEIFAIFMGATGGVYGFGKYRDSKDTIAETEMEKPAPSIVSENTDVSTAAGDIKITSKTKPKRKRR